MADERRYQEEEIAQIFEAAAAPRHSAGRAVSSADGLTLAELQAIGNEVGVAPERIADAASALDLRRSALPRRTHMGMPISASRTVELARAPTDREWELLVAELRQTFHAQGHDRSRGNLREWVNGNLHACVEPTQDGHRLRLGTLKGDGAAVNLMSLLGLIVLAVLLFSGEVADDLIASVILGAVSAGAFAWNAMRLPRWAREREDQMEYIAARAQALVKSEPERVGSGDSDG
jgi:hypothetical protein